MSDNYYTLLELEAGAGQDAIDSAYRHLALKYHPAVNPSANAYERMEQINQAWEVLSDPVRREAYDRSKSITRQRSVEPQATTAFALIPPQLVIDSQGEVSLRASLIQLPNLGFVSGVFWRLGIAIAVALIMYFTVLAGQNRLIWIEAVVTCAGLFIYSLLDARAGRFAWLGLAALSVTGAVVFLVAFPEVRLARAPAPVPARPSPTAVAIAPSPTFAPTATPDPGCPHGCVQQRAMCTIKGHVGPEGERVYYNLSDRAYGSVMMIPAISDRWFCSEAEAAASGWVHYQEPPTATPTPSPTPTLDTATLPKMYVCVPAANIRSGPGLDRSAVQHADQGSEWLVLGKVGEWYHVQQGTEDKGYYIHQSVLCSDNKSAVPSVTATPAQSAVGPGSSNSGVNAIGLKYQAPVLTGPSNGAAYQCSHDLLLQWTFVNPSALAADEWFLVESRQIGQENWLGITDWTKDLSAILHPDRGGGSCNALWWPARGDFEWRVAVIEGDIGSHALKKMLSPASASLTIRYR